VKVFLMQTQSGLTSPIARTAVARLPSAFSKERRRGPNQSRGWARTEKLGAVAQILFDHAGASGAVLPREDEADRASRVCAHHRMVR
jgi:hypothetical protein